MMDPGELEDRMIDSVYSWAAGLCAKVRGFFGREKCSGKFERPQEWPEMPEGENTRGAAPTEDEG